VPNVSIQNPILNSPFAEPTRHFRFDEDGITNTIADGRRRSTYFVPIAPTKKQRGAGQMSLAGEDWTAERMQENVTINRIRDHVAAFRRAGYPGVTSVTRELLAYWTEPDRAKPLFFCQIEALETAIFLGEVAGRTQPWIENQLREDNQAKNAGLYRVAIKMATGAGKTVVMGMLIAWQALNKIAYPQDKRFSDTFLVVTPGITIRDRLRVLLPNDTANYYVERDLVNADELDRLQRANVFITNFHTFLLRETFEAATLTKKVLVGPDGDPDRFRETPARMVRRVLGTLDQRRGIVVLNDEAHHCYQSAPQAVSDKFEPDERAEAKREQEAARVWLNGLRAVQKKVGIRAIYDLSATPFFLRGSGYPEGTLFPWVVSDFSLIDAIESGIVKVPRVPVADNAMTGEGPVFRNLWPLIRDELPKKGRATDAIQGDPMLPKELQAALHSLYGNYARSYEAWHVAGLGTPPVFIVVANNTNTSKIIFDWLAGYDRVLPDGSKVPVPGNLPIFSNVEHGEWLDRPNSLLIDSAQLESGEAMDPAFKKIAAVEIEEFKREYAVRYPGRSVDDLTDEDLLREVTNTIGKPGRLGEQVRCVVSVSMLTEGWDATTVTHILGVRAFGTQLLCEQVVGRGLRRISYEADDNGMFDPEYAEVYGVPFSFIPAVGPGTPQKPKDIHRVRALPERAALEITFPRLLGYRWDLPTEQLDAEFTVASVMTLATDEVPTMTEVDPIVGEKTVHRLDDLRDRRLQEVAFRIARRVLDEKFRDPDGFSQGWLYPQLVRITERWLKECVHLKDGAFPQMLILTQLEYDAADRIYRAIVTGTAGEKRLQPILRPYEPLGSTRDVAFDTTKGVYATEKSHLNYLVLDSGWEAKVGQVLEAMDEVQSYVKNQGLNFKIPYTFEGSSRNYVPDLIVRIDAGRSDALNLIIEVTGEAKKEKAAKTATARDLWVPAVNHHGGLGRWSFLEVTDPYDAEHLVRAHIAELASSQRALVGGGLSGAAENVQTGTRQTRQGHPPSGRPTREHPDRRVGVVRSGRGTTARDRPVSARHLPRPTTRLAGQGRTGRPRPRSRRRADLHSGADRAPSHHRGSPRPDGRWARGPTRPVRRLQRHALRRAGGLLPARAAVDEPDDLGRLPPGHDVTRREGGPEGQGPDDLRGPSVRDQVRLELAGEHA
jgi:type III restriction enzyme